MSIDLLNAELDVALDQRVQAHADRKAGVITVPEYLAALRQTRAEETRLEPQRRAAGAEFGRAFERALIDGWAGRDPAEDEIHTQGDLYEYVELRDRGDEDPLVPVHQGPFVVFRRVTDRERFGRWTSYHSHACECTKPDGGVACASCPARRRPVERLGEQLTLADALV